MANDNTPVNLPPETKVPAIPEKGASNFDDAIKELIEVREGVRGNPLDRSVTFRDLVDSGLAAPNPRAAGRGRIAAAQLITPSAGKQNLTVPPTPTGVTAVGAMTNIILSWNAPAYSNHAYAEIYRAEINDYGQAVKIGMSPGALYADAVGQGATRYYWIRFVSTANVQGAVSAGVKGQTALNPQYVMDNLLSERWQPSTGYVAFQYVRPTVDNGFLYMCIDPGVSAATEPAWPTVVFGEVVDGGAKWSCVEATERVPFMIGTVNGLPAVVIDSAYINDASISTAKIKNAFLDNLSAVHGTLVFARIEQGNIFELTIGRVIKSTNYSPGSSFCISPGNPGYTDGDGWIIRESRNDAAYIAEFYGDTLFSGDLRASRILSPMLVGAEYGVVSDADNCTFQFVAKYGTVSDVVYGDRSDPYLAYPLQVTNYPDQYGDPIPGITNLTARNQVQNGFSTMASGSIDHPFLGFKAGVQPVLFSYATGQPDSFYEPYTAYRTGSAPFDFSAMTRGLPPGIYNQSSIRTNPLNIISYIAESPRNYNRYRHRDIACAITFTRDSATTLSVPFAGATSVLRFRLMEGNTDNAAATLLIGFEFNANLGTDLVITLNGVKHYPVAGVATPDYSTYRYTIDNADLKADFLIRGYNAGTLLARQVFVSGGFIKLKRVAFSYAQPQGISVVLDTVTTFIYGSSTEGPSGLDIGFSFSSVMDNTV